MIICRQDFPYVDYPESQHFLQMEQLSLSSYKVVVSSFLPYFPVSFKQAKKKIKVGDCLADEALLLSYPV